VESHEDPGVYYGRGMAIVVYVDDVLFFGPAEAEMEKVITELQADGFELTLDCYVDADFAGLCGYTDDQDPVCVKSRSGYVMTLGGCPIHWTSRLQQEIALSTTEAEYISLAQALREFIPIHHVLEDMLIFFS
jgi:hypothetical protein